MRQWTIVENMPASIPSVWIVPQESFAEFSQIQWGAAQESPGVPEGSFMTVAYSGIRVIVVQAPPVRQVRQQIFRDAARAAAKMGSDTVGLWVRGWPGASLPSVMTGVEQGFYRYHSLPPSSVRRVTVVGDETSQPILAKMKAIADAQSLVRDWVNMPPNEKPPEVLASLYREGAPAGIDFRTYHEQDLAEMEAGGILAVGSGSARPPALLLGRYQGAGDDPWLALVGKGITFDSGGISLKKPEGMGRLKGDMAGSAAVMAALRVVAQLGWRVNVMALAPMAENLPDGRAFRPGDVLTMLDKTRVEVISTDAEGRLVLADAVTLALREGAAQVVDMATLTGSNVVALGGVRASLITNHDGLARLVAQAGERMEEPAWIMPNDPEYARFNDSSIADLKNSGGPKAGTISAGLFVGHFARHLPWVHLDIAGLGFDGQDGSGATGYGVATLVELCELWPESVSGRSGE